jgi:hypothetical protein
VNQADFTDLPLGQALVREKFRGSPEDDAGDNGGDGQRNQKWFLQESSPTS